ncbi:MAG: helix-turn-helix domain-containing protein [Bacilli bacterium]
MGQYVDGKLHELTKHGEDDFPIVIYGDSYSLYGNRFYYSHYHEEIEILFVLNGAISIDVNDTTYRISEGEILFINSNNLHLIKHDLDEDAKIVPFLFSPKLFRNNIISYKTDEIINNILNTNFEAFIIKDEKIFSDLCNLKIRKNNNEKLIELDYIIVIYEIMNYIYKNNKLVETKPQTRKNENLLKALNYIYENYSTQIKVETIASIMGLSEGEASRTFKKLTGQSPIEYLIHYRINMAIILLKNTTKSITDIAFEVGFLSSNYFTISFKKITGLTPSKYKKKELIYL